MQPDAAVLRHEPVVAHCRVSAALERGCRHPAWLQPSLTGACEKCLLSEKFWPYLDSLGLVWP